MSFKFIMPELGEGLAEGTISAWDVAVGDTVEEDQDLVEIENDKAVTDLPSPVAGTVTKINFGEGETAKVGDVLIVIDDGSPDDDTDDDSAATGRAMATSHATIPPVTNFGEVEVGALLKLRKRYKAAAADQDIHLTVLPFIVKALVAALKKYPVLNSSLDTETDEIVYHSACNVAIATDTDRGLYAPVVKDADRANILEIARAIGDNADKAADGKLSADDMSGASVTVSNLGGVDGGWFTPIITSPQAAILGVGRAVKAPYVNDDGDLAVGQMMKLSLTYDHRIIDGVRGQEILNTVMRLLHDPNLLIIEG
jgi:pyruvate dehydrogenase E2 component (dihydrolipoamide acetyltransferase)